MTGSCQKKEAVARLETSCWQRQLPEVKKKGADHFSRLSGILHSVPNNRGSLVRAAGFLTARFPSSGLRNYMIVAVVAASRKYYFKTKKKNCSVPTIKWTKFYPILTPTPLE